MEISVFAALCAEGKEHECAWDLLAYAVRKVFGMEELPEVMRSEKGKPYFSGYPRICFNLSHSHGAVVCALHDKPIGVDIEKLRRAPKRLAAGLSDDTFFHRWTSMEATVKREGGSAAALRKGIEPDVLCRVFEDALPGWVVAVCPSEKAEIRFSVID